MRDVFRVGVLVASERRVHARTRTAYGLLYLSCRMSRQRWEMPRPDPRFSRMVAAIIAPILDNPKWSYDEPAGFGVGT
jgi:hypothetical protein